jgi:hypothetical protein
MDDESTGNFDDMNPPILPIILTNLYSNNQIKFGLWNAIKKYFNGLLVSHLAFLMRRCERDYWG